MTDIFIFAEYASYRREIADLLRASGRHVATTSDLALLLLALHTRPQPLIILLSERTASQLGAYFGACEAPDLDPLVSPRASIVLTRLPLDELPDTVRTFVRLAGATLLDPNCSVATMLTAMQEAEERLACVTYGAYGGIVVENRC